MQHSNYTIKALPQAQRPVAGLVSLWRASVAATHSFLAPGEIDRLAPEAEAGIAGVQQLAAAFDENGKPLGFCGVNGHMVEMLFIAPECRGRGLGCGLLAYARRHWQIARVDVNEQNTGGAGFYTRCGFTTQSRSETDSAGRPYPILHLALTQPEALDNAANSIHLQEV